MGWEPTIELEREIRIASSWYLTNNYIYEK